MDHLPPAPTPPVNNNQHNNMASNGADRTSNLLNLLKFSGSGARDQQAQQPSQTQQQQQQSPIGSQPAQSSQQHSPAVEHQPHHHQHRAPLSPPQQSYQQTYQQNSSQNQNQNQHYLGYQQQQPPQSHQYQMQPQQAHESHAEYQHRIHQPAPAAADPTGLLAALMRGAHDSESPAPRPHEHQHSQQDQQQHVQSPPQQSLPAQQQQQQQQPQANPFGSGGSPPPETRSHLLNLLNRPKPSQNEQPLMAETSRSNNDTPQSPDLGEHTREFLSQFSQQTSVDAYAAAKQYQAQTYGQGYGNEQHHPQQQQKADDPANVELYQQLMGTLAQKSSPHGSAAAHSASASAAGQPFQVLKKDHSSPAGSQHHGSQRGANESYHDHRSPAMSPQDLHRRKANRTSSLHSHQSASVSKPTPTSIEFERHGAPEHKETVSEAVTDLGPKADRDARDALNKAEHERSEAEIADELDRMLNADSDAEFNHNARDVARDLQDELDKSENEGVLDQTLPREVADTVREIVDEAAQGVADSWESADQEEIVVIEEREEPPVKVFNFPMKPWISVSLLGGTAEPRPEFRYEAVMDVARLKKEFDQIDRNLYTASPNYMTYGMSKQGGLRIIRQEDGKDAKVFTDTKDRIFNVAMSVTPADYEGTYREAIIGTGISGTVYWVQIRDGEKDHTEDAHLEQYGFALPPMSSSEGDTPGGVLKTRARASTSHPGFFAVGRGKTINFVWPSYIMQNNLFKPGHDRVVDTEKLLSQCSLKINTGKAGKDFTFSQDDSVVVSLDKSGRVKFWDVRDLTATKSGSDPRHPVPEHTSMEVRDPLMTLGSTPEGEKAWPTSVLLLDKQRPYQKRCALRYMIVGMKQNHTLQLWDLALGKPVQEFNLPHSKESDAVCSVMYHAASGMIVIGHPTRNSVYFAHLSAPKYNLKSMSQAEYIERLVAQDSSIPQPDSTAVISGVREYSFENRGVLRSLDILPQPAIAQDTDEAALFELYAMHSKGVACLLIKQRDLGWSKDNKVLAPVDAVSEGIVTVSKLKTPQAMEAEVKEMPVPIRNGNRGAKDTTAAPVPSVDTSIEPDTSTKNKPEPKDVVETPAAPPAKENQPEKPERKPRKKKGAAAAAAAAANNQGDATTNGASSGSNAGKGGNASGMSNEALNSAVASMETRITAGLADALKGSLKGLQTQIDDSARERDVSFNDHQRKLLDMVSEVLNDNTQKVLQALIHHQFTEQVIPAIGETAGRAVTELLDHKLQPNVAKAVHKEIQNTLPQAVNRSLRANDFVQSVTDRIGPHVAQAVQQEVVASLTQRLAPTLTNAVGQSTKQMSTDLRQQYHEQYEHLKAQRAADSHKIDQLKTHVQQMADMISQMASSQSALQAEILKLKQTPVHELPGLPGPQGHPGMPGPQQSYGGGAHGQPGPMLPSQQSSYAPSQAPSHAHTYAGSPQYARGGQFVTSPPGSHAQSEQLAGSQHSVSAIASTLASQLNRPEAQADQDLQQRSRRIDQLIQEDRLQDAVIQWIQSGHEDLIFKRTMSRYPPSKFENLPPLMLLVMIATISKDIKPNALLKEEVDWIEMAIRSFDNDIHNHDWNAQPYRDVARSGKQTMQLLVTRMQALSSGIQPGYPIDPFLANVDKNKLDWIVRTSDNILHKFAAMGHYE